MLQDFPGGPVFENPPASAEFENPPASAEDMGPGRFLTWQNN